jgi:hypothetical protein
MKYINLENKSLSELIELRNHFSGTNTFRAVDYALWCMLTQPYNQMLEHCKKRSCEKVKKFNIKSNSYR